MSLTWSQVEPTPAGPVLAAMACMVVVTQHTWVSRYKYIVNEIWRPFENGGPRWLPLRPTPRAGPECTTLVYLITRRVLKITFPLFKQTIEKKILYSKKIV